MTESEWKYITGNTGSDRYVIFNEKLGIFVIGEYLSEKDKVHRTIRIVEIDKNKK